jgi:hypothetical protein
MNEKTENGTKTKRILFEEKLKLLGITEYEFQSFFELFVQNPHRYMIKKEGEEWQVVKTKTGRYLRLDKNVLAYHLMKRYWIATFAPEVPRYLCIDIDDSKHFSWVYNTVIEWVPRSIVIFSSEGKGVHIYAFIHHNFPIRSYKLLTVASKELEIRGVKTAPGTCEIFPAPNRFLRLPLGKGSCLLDPNSRTRLNLDLAESIRFIKENLYRHTFEELFPRLYSKRALHNG